MAEDQTVRTTEEDECEYLFLPENRHWLAKIVGHASEMRLFSGAPLAVYTCYVRTLWNTKADAYPTVKQLDAVLRKMLVNCRKRAVIRKVYLRLFPWVGSSFTSPRSLKHLCRCSINERLDYLDEAEKLPLPDQLKQYLERL